MKRFAPWPCTLLLLSSPLLAAVDGTVRFEGEPPAESTLRMNADPKCDELHGGEKVTTALYVVGEEGGLADVFVWVKDVPEGDYPTPAEPQKITQKGCLYSPTVMGLQVDQVLEIENQDDILHNVRALARTNRPFNLGQPGVGVRTKSFKEPEDAIKVKCDVHPWMESHIFVLDHPFFAVTGPEGSFSIAGLPAGTYTLGVWHSRLGSQEAEIVVGADGTATADFSYSMP